MAEMANGSGAISCPEFPAAGLCIRAETGTEEAGQVHLLRVSLSNLCGGIVWHPINHVAGNL